MHNKHASYLALEVLLAALACSAVGCARRGIDNGGMAEQDIEKMADRLPWGTPAEVADKLIRLAEHTGAGTVQVNFNRGAMPQEMFVEQIRRFARDVLPIVQAHQITKVPAAEELAA